MSSWTSSDPAVKGDVLGWMAIILWRWHPWKRGFPTNPILSTMFANASHSFWTTECYDEIRLLGEVAGFPFETYVLGLHDCLMKRDQPIVEDPASTPSNAPLLMCSMLLLWCRRPTLLMVLQFLWSLSRIVASEAWGRGCIRKLIMSWPRLARGLKL